MLHQNVLPTGASFVRILQEISHLEGGKHVHACIRLSPFAHDVAVRSTLVSMYGRCGSFDDALKAFLDMPSSSPSLSSASASAAASSSSSASSSAAASPPHVVTWNAIISACSRYQNGFYAHRLFQQMLLECVVASNVTFISLVRAYSSQGMLSEGKRLHARICGSGLEDDAMIRNNLSSMYTKCGSPENGSELFRNAAEGLMLEEGKHMHSHACGDNTFAAAKARLRNGSKLFDCNMSEECNVVSWTNLISSYAGQGCLHESLSIYSEMQEVGVNPNSYTFVTLLSGCSNIAAALPGQLLHFHVMCCYHSPDTMIGNTLIRMYSACGCLEDAFKVFQDLNDSGDVVSWTSIIAAYAQQGISHEAVQNFSKMQERGVFPDKITFLVLIDALSSHEESKRIHVCILNNEFEQDIAIGSALVSMYRKYSQPENAGHAFHPVEDCSSVARNILLTTFAQKKETQNAFAVFYQILQEGLIPDKSAYVAMLEACASHSYIIESAHMHIQIIFAGFGGDITIQTSLIHMYGKSGNVERAWYVFTASQTRDRPIWNAMIQVFSQYGKGNEVIGLFDQMNHGRVAPDAITFTGMILACSHSGLVEEGWRCLLVMVGRCAVEPDVEHFNCMVDLLGRAGCVDEGAVLVKNMACRPSLTTWTALLSACRIHRNPELADIAAMHAYQLEPGESGTYVLLSDIHGEAL